MENTEIIQKARAKAEMWLNDAYDKATRTEVERLLNASDPTELIDSFYNDLEFGTGGLRGIMGVGSNRMNIYTVGAATQGFANYINRLFPGENNSVCIGHDCRHHSREYAETTAAIFSANGITAYLFESLRPTPEMSFAIRELGCKGGVIITASHNPKEYNGYKAYWNDGSQLVPPHDKNVIDEVKKVKVTDIKFTAVPDKIKTLGEDFDQKFLNTVKTLSLSPEAIQHQHDLKIVFTPLHGTTYKLVPASLRNWGFTNITTIPEQMITDGDFPTVASANPEEPAAFKMALDKAREIDADLAMACDPDGDRTPCRVILNGVVAEIVQHLPQDAPHPADLLVGPLYLEGDLAFFRRRPQLLLHQLGQGIEVHDLRRHLAGALVQAGELHDVVDERHQLGTLLVNVPGELPHRLRVHQPLLHQLRKAGDGREGGFQLMGDSGEKFHPLLFLFTFPLDVLL